MDLDDTTYIIVIDDVEVVGEGEGERGEGGESYLSAYVLLLHID